LDTAWSTFGWIKLNFWYNWVIFGQLS